MALAKPTNIFTKSGSTSEERTPRFSWSVPKIRKIHSRSFMFRMKSRFSSQRLTATCTNECEGSRGPPTIELQLPNTFYIRDCEIDHFKDLITIIEELGRKNRGPVTQTAITNQVQKRRPKIAAAGYNHLITLRSLGALDARNRLTPKGYHLFGLIEKRNESFRREFCDYLYCFLINVMNALVLIANDKNNTLKSIDCTYQEIADKICEVWGQTVRFMYDARTISTAMRILHELGAVEYTDSAITLKKLVHATYLPWGERQGRLNLRTN